MSVGKTVRIRKFTSTQILFHWLYGGAWIVLVLTGILFLWRPDPNAGVTGLGVALQGTVGQWLRFLHRVAALVFVISPLVWILREPRGFSEDFGELLTWRRDDARYLMLAPLHYTLGKPPLPPQGKYNGGHKLNFLIVLLTFVGFVVSGFTLWFGRGLVEAETWRLMLLIHSLSFWVGLLMGLLHIYLTMVHPFTRQALSTVLNGYVGLGYARAEHRIWVDEQVRTGKADLIEEPRP